MTKNQMKILAILLAIACLILLTSIGIKCKTEALKKEATKNLWEEPK